MSNFFSGTSTRRISVDITGNTTNLERALGRAEGRLKRFDGRTEKLGQGLRGSFTGAGVGSKGSLLFGSASFVGAAAASAVISKSISEASNLNEQLSKSNVVFGQNADAVAKWSETMATSFGIARTEAVAAAASFGSLFKGTGSTQAEAAKLSRSVVELAGDLASFNNTSTEDALGALRSGLSGEIEPLRRFQVFLTEASVAQEAMVETGKKSSKELTQGEKILARYNLILRQTKDAQGDFARTSGSLANQQRTLTAQTANLEAKLGKVLLPTMTALVGALNDAFAAADALGGALGKLAAVPAINIPINFVFGGGRGAEIFQDILLGQLSPAALGFKLGKQGFDALFGGDGSAAGSGDGRHGAGRSAAIARGRAGGGGSTPALKALNREQTLLLNQQRAQLTAFLSDDVAAAQALVKLRQEQVARAGPKKQFEAQQKLIAAQQDLQDVQTQIAERQTEQTKKNSEKLKDAAKKTGDALKKQAQAFKNQADAIKSAVLDAFDTKSQKIDNARALKDAREALRVARQEGGVKGIQQASRGLQDARRAVERQRLEQTNFRVTAGPAGPVNALQVGNVVINVNGAGNPDEVARRVLAIIRKRGKQNAGQQRGRDPGGNPSHR